MAEPRPVRPAPETRAPEPDAPLPLRLKIGFALGDHSVNIQLAAVSLFLLFFLTEVAGLEPVQAGLVLWIGRAVDAFTDPAMGRLSDVTRWRAGRRRPFFLIGAVPFGVSFALIWSSNATGDGGATFAWYVALYVVNTLFSTVLAVPYMALLPELALGYEERTSLNSFRMVAVVAGILLTAVGWPLAVSALGGGHAGYAATGWIFGLWMIWPWLVVFAVSWERPGFQRPSAVGFVGGARRMLGHRSYRVLAVLFLAARIAVDVVGALFPFYFTYWLARFEDFPIAMALMLGGVIVSLPFWLRVSERLDKRTAFVAGALWWVAMQGAIAVVEPGDPRWWILAISALAGIGYGVADLMPWSMLGDVIDEDELATGERREGVYAGFFTFLRKLGGASGVALAGFVLQASGFREGGGAQSPEAIATIRWLTALAPALFLVLASAIALRYPLDRARHREILRALSARRGAEGPAAAPGAAGAP